jgi:hypothetical protein
VASPILGFPPEGHGAEACHRNLDPGSTE